MDVRLHVIGEHDDEPHLDDGLHVPPHGDPLERELKMKSENQVF